MALSARRLVLLSVPSAIALTAYLNANAINALVGADLTMVGTQTVALDAPKPTPSEKPTVNSILARNAFDHVTGSLLQGEEEGTTVVKVRDDDPRTAPPCANVRALAAVRAQSAEYSFAALEASGRKVLRRRGDAIDGTSPAQPERGLQKDEGAILKVAFVGEDRVWLDDGTSLCQARIGAALPGGAPSSSSQPPKDPPPKTGALESKLQGKILRSGPNEFQIDRGAVDILLEAQTELMKTQLVPDKEGDRVVGLRLTKLRAGSALTMLGLEENDRLVSMNGIEVSSPEKMIEAYARLKTGNLDRITIHIVRKGKPTNLDYTIR